jgi:two-component system sensor histidine kinase RpfC
LLALINSILDFARIEAGQMPKTRVDFDLYTLVFDIRKMLAVQADAKNVRLSVHITPRVPRMLRGPKSHMSEILMNLAANAVKFTERGYVLVAVDAVGAAGGRTRLRFEVSDTGIGIKPEAQGRIFDSFAQADETIMDRFGGTGLGLALVKQLVELHGGEIGVESTPGVGSTFWCELEFDSSAIEAPARPPAGTSVVLQSSDVALRLLLESAVAKVDVANDPAELVKLVGKCRKRELRAVVVVDDRSSYRHQPGAPVSAELPASTPAILITDAAAAGMLAGSARSRFVTTLSSPLTSASVHTALDIAFGGAAADSGSETGIIAPATRKLKVLIAEDNRTNQQVIAKILERAGHQARIAENGEQAMDAMCDGQFDIVLMDVNMPVMNGIEAAKLYRFASLGQKRIPILALTADASPEMEERCREAGMDGCLTKPIEPRRLLATIEQMAGENVEEGAPSRGTTEDVVEARGDAKSPAVLPLALNRHVLDDLQSLGGTPFVNELAAQFLADAAASLQNFERAATLVDTQAFRDHAHALRSAAANIGAQIVFQTCLSLRDISSSELRSDGGSHVRRLTSELHSVRSALDSYLAEINAVQDAPVTLSAKRAAAG